MKVEIIMKENIQNIAIKKLGCIVDMNGITEYVQENDNLRTQLQVEAMNIGFIFSKGAIDYLLMNPFVYSDVFQNLNRLVGNDRDWTPMYRNFPDEVFEKSESELYLNAIAHYQSKGTWMPTSVQTNKIPTFEKVILKEIDLAFKQDIEDMFVNILNSNGSITPYDKEVLEYSVSQYGINWIKRSDIKITFKETLCYFTTLLFNGGFGLEAITNSIKTSTDVLRIAVSLSGGDISLLEKPRFKLNNKQRKFIVSILENVISESDISRHSDKWIHLFHCLHIGQFKKAVKSNEIANKLRNAKLEKPNSKIEIAIKNNDKKELKKLLSRNYGDFARRLDHLVREFDGSFIVQFFNGIQTVDTRVLLKMLSHFKYRNQRNYRIVIPKGSTKKAYLLDKSKNGITGDEAKFIISNIERELSDRFEQKEVLGSVYIDDVLKSCPIPMQMRTASDGLLVMQRGSRLKLDTEKSILRFFIHWTGNDVDLSATFLKEDLSYHSVISYYGLKNTNGYKAAHSGDITRAPQGACEFIDIDLNSITDKSIRYIAMDVRVYNGGTLAEQLANAGWMMRDENYASTSRIFDANTVEQRVSLTSGKTALVALFDVVNREVIWMDCEGSSREMFSGNNVHNNKPSIIQIARMFTNLKQMSLYDLFELHAKSRGKIIENKDSADIVFDQSYVFKHTEVLSQYL